MQIHSLWLAEGRPCSGPTFDEKRRICSNYKRAIRAAQKAPKQIAWNKIHMAMESEDTNQLWNSWHHLYNQSNDQFAPVVDGCSDKKDIAEAFRISFESNSVPNNVGKVNDINNVFLRHIVDSALTIMIPATVLNIRFLFQLSLMQLAV